MRVTFAVTLPDYYTRVQSHEPNGVLVKQANIHYCGETVVGVKRKKPVGWMEPTNYTFIRYRSTAAYGNIKLWISPTNWATYSGFIGNGPKIVSTNNRNSCYSRNTRPSVATENSALIKARNQWQSPEVNYGQAIGESNQTARLVGDSCLRIVNAARALARGDVRKVAKNLTVHGKPPRKFVKKVQKTMSAAGINRLRKKMTKAESIRFDKNIKNMKNVTGAWLELQYGWKPLMSDVAGSIQNLQSFDKYSWIQTAKGSARENIHKTRVDSGPTSDFAGRTEAKGFLSIKYILIGVPQNSPAQIGNDLGLANLPLVGWELVPFSFVVDWFLPVGAWIDSLDATLNYTEMRTVKSIFCKVNWRDFGDMSAPHATWTKESSYSGSAEEIQLIRTVSSGVPIPGRPSIKDPFSYAHMANGLALLVQIFGPGKSSVVR